MSLNDDMVSMVEIYSESSYYEFYICAGEAVYQVYAKELMSYGPFYHIVVI